MIAIEQKGVPGNGHYIGDQRYEPLYVRGYENCKFNIFESENAGYAFSEIVNTKGLTLPGTGGIGTAIFYAVGGLLMAAAVIFLIAKKRMQNLNINTSTF